MEQGEQPPGGKRQVASPRHEDKEGTTAKLNSNSQDFIGRQLRAVYDAVLNEEVPERFLKLLQELERGSDKTS